MFGRRITLFHLFGFAVRVDASWLLIAALVTWSLAFGLFPVQLPGLSSITYLWMGLLGALLFFGSIVVHEFAHSLVARQYGLPMRGITLFIFGGIAEMDEEPASPKTEFLMAGAGPLTSILVGFVFYGMAAALQDRGFAQLVTIFGYLATINWLLAAFNLLPAFPLDGGRMLRSGIWAYSNNLEKATRISARIGSGFGVLLMVLAVVQLFRGNLLGAIWWFLIGMFLRQVAIASYQQMQIRRVLQGEPVRRFMHEHPDTVHATASVEDLVENHIYRYHHQMFPVLDSSEHLTGCVSTDEVRALPRGEWSRHTVAEIMLPCTASNVVTPETDAMDALKRMSDNRVTRLLVVDHGHLIAIISVRDLLQFIASKLQLEDTTTLQHV